MSGFDWPLNEEAEKHLKQVVDWFLDNCPAADRFSAQVEAITATRLFDWIDHVKLPRKMLDAETISKHGFSTSDRKKEIWKAEGTTLFPIQFVEGDAELAIRVQDIEVFAKARGSKGPVLGERFSPFRQLEICSADGWRMIAVERRGDRGFEPVETDDLEAYSNALLTLDERQRRFAGDAEGLEALSDLVGGLRAGLSEARLADAFARAEIRYWQTRNATARAQRAAQDELGLGWANTDHLTFRCSRQNFRHLIRVLEVLGFEPRERFYAGATAGWGAQIMEHPVAGLVVFADVDLAPDETQGDFAHAPLKELKQSGTVGLWVGLHGESVLQAGMHHLAVRVDFDRSRELMASEDVEVMKPFSDFPFLRQAFTKGEMWSVERERLAALKLKGQLKVENANQFGSQGAVGSHLELIQRGQGFKGFNQTSVSAIIRATNPLLYVERAA